jgi:hypothetical protein
MPVRRNGVPLLDKVYEGEGHGFRKTKRGRLLLRSGTLLATICTIRRIDATLYSGGKHFAIHFHLPGTITPTFLYIRATGKERDNHFDQKLLLFIYLCLS